jgi:hypothetical protein
VRTHSELPASGVCCDNGIVDSCGVCGGVNSCGASVEVSMSFIPQDDGYDSTVVTPEMLAAILGVPVEYISVLLMHMDGSTVCETVWYL